MDDYFLFDRPLHLIICRICSYGVRLEHCGTHLRTHHRLTTAQIAPLIEELRRTIDQPSDGGDSTSSDDDSPVVGLPVYRDGLQCVTCGYICRKIKDIEAHCRTKHR